MGFDSRWDEVLLSTPEVPSGSILEGLYKMRIRESDQLKTVLALYEQASEQKNTHPSFQRLKTILKKFFQSEDESPKFLRPEAKEP